jgi:hypothetical protein
MARELKGYGRKRQLGLVPHRYDGKLRGVHPPVTTLEGRRAEGETRQRAWRDNAWRTEKRPFDAAD